MGYDDVFIVAIDLGGYTVPALMPCWSGKKDERQEARVEVETATAGDEVYS
jgi:hypothetical protein